MVALFFHFTMLLGRVPPPKLTTYLDGHLGSDP